MHVLYKYVAKVATPVFLNNERFKSFFVFNFNFYQNNNCTGYNSNNTEEPRNTDIFPANS